MPRFLENAAFLAHRRESERVFLTPNEYFVSYILLRTHYIQWDDDDVRYVL